MAMKGNELFQLFVEMTGLEHGTVEDELRKLMQRLNMDPETLTTEDIRRLMAHYLEEFNDGVTQGKATAEANFSNLADPVSEVALEAEYVPAFSGPKAEA
jgi:hypothetical protein